VPDSTDLLLLKLSVAKNLIDQDLAKDIYQQSLAEKRSVTAILLERELMTQHIVDQLLKEMGCAQPPKTVGGFRIVSKLGQGGMGAVYKAIQLSMEREVALKVIAPEFAQDKAAAERFLREALAAGRVSHPNVVSCYDAGQDGGILYLAMELVTGGDVEQLSRAQGGKLPESRALEIIRDAARGLQALHEAGLIHRDIKPTNIFLSDRGEAKLADLGLARSQAGDDRMTQAGTPAFMSPEQANGDDDLDIRSDIYSLGATLFALVTGQAPYRGGSPWAVLASVIKDPFPDPRAVAPAVTDPVAAVILKACAKDRTQRYQVPDELAADLERALSFEPPLAVAPARPPPGSGSPQPIPETSRPRSGSGRPRSDPGRPRSDTGRPRSDTGRPRSDPGRPRSDPGRSRSQALTLQGLVLAVLVGVGTAGIWLAMKKEKPVEQGQETVAAKPEAAVATEPSTPTAPATPDTPAAEPVDSVPTPSADGPVIAKKPGPAPRPKKRGPTSPPKGPVDAPPVPAPAPATTPVPAAPAGPDPAVVAKDCRQALELIRTGKFAEAEAARQKLPSSLGASLAAVTDAVRGLPAAALAEKANLVGRPSPIGPKDTTITDLDDQQVSLEAKVGRNAMSTVLKWARIKPADQLKLLSGIRPQLAPERQRQVILAAAAWAGKPEEIPADEPALTPLRYYLTARPLPDAPRPTTEAPKTMFDASRPTTEAPAPAATSVYLSDLAELNPKVGYGEFGKHGDLGYEEKRITVMGVESPHGLSTHPPPAGTASVSYHLGRQYRLFKCGAAFDDTCENNQPMLIFRVRGDGKVLWERKFNQGQKECSVSVSGVDLLTLEVVCEGYNRSAHTVWLEPLVINE
jgi:serine/threonine protein kinase